MSKPSSRSSLESCSGGCPALLLALLLGACAPGGMEVGADALPGRYPNLLSSVDETLEFALLAPFGWVDGSSTSLEAVACSADGDREEVAALEPFALRDVDGDGIEDLVATFSVAELLAAGLIGAGSVPLRVDAREHGKTLLTGTDRVLGSGAPIARLPTVAGPFAVGTARHYLFDPERDRLNAEGRPLYVRFWYPAVSSPAQPASYFLVPESARLTATSLGLPEDFLDAVHASSVLDAEPAALGPRPTLLLSTGLGVPLDVYAALAEDFASRGYLVVGVGHPDGGSGPIAYPDGTVSQDDIAAALGELDSVEDPEEWLALVDQFMSATSLEWARDLSFVLDSIESADQQVMPRRLRRVLTLADSERVGALGHSFGGSAAIEADLLAERIRASADLDGTIWGAPLEQGPDSSVLILQSDDSGTLDEETDLTRFLSHRRGATYVARVNGSIHDQFSDILLLVAALPPLGEELGLGESPLDPARVSVIQNAYVQAFFGQELSAQPSLLLSGATPEFPEVTLDVFDAVAP